MDSSLTPNAETSTRGKLWICLQNLQLSASLEESIMRMEEFIFIASWTSEEYFGPETHESSILRDAIRTYSTLVELRGWLTITALRTAMWSREEQSDQKSVEIEFQRLMRRGLSLWRQQLETNFFVYANNWLLRSSQLVSTASHRLPTGHIRWCLNHIDTQNTLPSYRIEWAHSIRGLRRIWAYGQEVSDIDT